MKSSPTHKYDSFFADLVIQDLKQCMKELYHVTAAIPVFNGKIPKQKPFLGNKAFIKGALGLNVNRMIIIDEKSQSNGSLRSTWKMNQ